MAITISKLSVILTGSVAGFAAAMEEGKNHLSGFQQRFERTAERVADVSALMFTGLTLDSGIEFLKNTFEQIDATTKLAGTLGVATESLQRMEYAGKLAGASADDVSGGMEKMLKAIGEAESQGGQLGQVFTSLKLNLGQLSAEKPEDAFARISDALNKIQDPATRAYDASQIFGRGWAKIGTLIGRGGASMKAAGIEADNLGLTLSREATSKIIEANDAIIKMEASFQGMANSIVIAVSPAVLHISDLIRDLSTSLHDINPFVISSAMEVGKWVAAWEGITLIAPILITALDGVAVALKSIAAGEIITTALASKQAMGQLAGKLILAYGLVKLMDKAFDGAADSAQHFKTSVNDLGNATANIPPVPKIKFDKFDPAKDINKILGDLVRQREELGKSKDEISLMRLAWDGASQAEYDYAQKQINLRKSMEQSADTQKIIVGLQREISDFNVPDAWRKIYDLEGKIPDAQMHQIQGLQKILDGLEKQKQATNAAAEAERKKSEDAKRATEQAINAGKELYEATRNPAEKYAEELQRINTLLKKNAITEDTAQRARQKALSDSGLNVLNKPIDSDTTAEAPKFLEAGSQAAGSFLSEMKSKEQAERHNEQIAANTTDMRQSLHQIASNTSRSGEIRIVAMAI